MGHLIASQVFNMYIRYCRLLGMFNKINDINIYITYNFLQRIVFS